MPLNVCHLLDKKILVYLLSLAILTMFFNKIIICFLNLHGNGKRNSFFLITERTFYAILSFMSCFYVLTKL